VSRAFTFVFSILSTLMVASCGSVEQVCDDYATAWCSAHYRCATGAVLANLQSLYGATVADCTAVQENGEHENCLGATANCPAGTSYDTGAAENCVNDVNNSGMTGDPNAISCEDLLNDGQPASCNPDLICH
jgi:hypothetical protein